MSVHQPDDQQREDQPDELRREINRLKEELARANSKLARADSKLAAYASLRRATSRLFLWTVFGSRFYRAFAEFKDEVTRVLDHLRRKDYRASYDEVRRVEPEKAYKLIGAFVIWRYRPRVLFIIAGVLLSSFTTYLLYQQNKLIKRQNDLSDIQTKIADRQTDLMKSQTALNRVQADATQLQAVSFILSSLDPDEPIKNEVAISQLAEYGANGFEALVRLSEGKTRVSRSAMMALLQQHKAHNPEQVFRTLKALDKLVSPSPEQLQLQSSNLTLKQSEGLLALAPDIQTYLTGITGRCADNEFRGRLEGLIKSQDALRGLALMYVAYHQHIARFVGTTSPKGPYPVTRLGPTGSDPRIDFDLWKYAVYKFCRSLAGAFDSGSDEFSSLVDDLDKALTDGRTMSDYSKTKLVLERLEMWLKTRK